MLKKSAATKFILRLLLIAILLYVGIQALRSRRGEDRAREKLTAYPVNTQELSYGNMTYIDGGSGGEVILSLHGIFGGYDQAFENVRGFSSQYRILAPSRFGYLGSDIRGEGNPSDQAKALEEFLDYLKIDQAFILGTSAGGTPAIRFALDYPERTKGLILYKIGIQIR